MGIRVRVRVRGGWKRGGVGREGGLGYVIVC